MANTVIQLKYSTVTDTPVSLNVGEPAYSYSSNTLYIGTPGSDGAIAIGGRFYLDQQQIIFNTANAAFETANNSTKANAAFDHANSAFEVANSAAIAANTPSHVANSAASYANSAFAAANTADAKAVTAGSYANSAFVHANSGFDAANTADAKAVTAGSYANSAFLHANSAFTRANNSLNANTGGTVTGTVVITGDLDVTGNLVITGNTITQNVTTLNIADPLIYLAANNYSSDIVEIGFAANYYDGSTQRHTGFFREASNKEFYIFDNYDKEPDANLIDINDASFRIATLHANLKSQSVTLNGQDLQTYVDNAYAAANTADSKAVSAGSYANSAFVHANSGFNAANTADSKAVSAGSYANSAFEAANTADAKAVTAGSYANSAFAHANAAYNTANTDVTNVSITAGDFGGASIVPTFHVTANGRIDSVSNVSIAIGASQITSGTLGVERGGTGATTFTTNGVLLGQGTSAITTASSSTEGHVLTINGSGVPTFAYIQGGTF